VKGAFLIWVCQKLPCFSWVFLNNTIEFGSIVFINGIGNVNVSFVMIYTIKQNGIICGGVFDEGGKLVSMVIIINLVLAVTFAQYLPSGLGAGFI